MTDNVQDRGNAIKARFQTMEIDTSDPKWSSSVLDRLLREAVSAPGGSLQDVYRGLDAALRDYAVKLTATVANLIKDVVVAGFTQHKAAYRAMSWDWANEALSQGASAARCYLFLHALPPEAATPHSIVTILRGLEGTCYRQEALNTLSDDLEKPEVQELLSVP